MNSLPSGTGGSLRQIIRLLSVIALGAASLSVTMWIANASAGKAQETALLAAVYQATNLTETSTPTTSTATLVATTTALPDTPAPTGTPRLVAICHHTGSANNPYVPITIGESAVPAHSRHGDIIPAPAGGCPAAVTRTPAPLTATPGTTPSATPITTGTVTAEKVTICHRTGSQRNPYVMITTSANSVPAHAAHGDTVPAPADGCPSVAPTDGAYPAKGKGLGDAKPNGKDKAINEPPGQQKVEEKAKVKEKDESSEGAEKEKDESKEGQKNKP